jgi:hypothetical protein
MPEIAVCLVYKLDQITFPFTDPSWGDLIDMRLFSKRSNRSRAYIWKLRLSLCYYGNAFWKNMRWSRKPCKSIGSDEGETLKLPRKVSLFHLSVFLLFKYLTSFSRRSREPLFQNSHANAIKKQNPQGVFASPSIVRGIVHATFTISKNHFRAIISSIRV